MLYITVGCYTKEENKVENIPQCKKKTLEIPPRSILRFHTGKEMKKLFNSQIELLQESNFDLMWVGLWLVGLGLHFWSVQAWFCIVQLSPSLLLKFLPLSLTHLEVHVAHDGLVSLKTHLWLSSPGSHFIKARESLLTARHLGTGRESIFQGKFGVEPVSPPVHKHLRLLVVAPGTGHWTLRAKDELHPRAVCINTPDEKYIFREAQV